MLKKPKAVIFDWDNTLADSWHTIHNALEMTFIEMNKTPWTIDEVKEKVHRSLRDSFPEIFGDNWQKAGEIYIKNFEATHIKNIKPIDFAEDSLKFLLDSNIYTAVVSNKTGKFLRLEVSHLGWDKYFTKVVGARDAEEDKPSIKPVLMALDGSGIDHREIWFVGDTVSDMECAYNSGCVPVLYGERDLNSSEFTHCRPLKRFENHQLFCEGLRELWR